MKKRMLLCKKFIHFETDKPVSCSDTKPRSLLDMLSLNHRHCLYSDYWNGLMVYSNGIFKVSDRF